MANANGLTMAGVVIFISVHHCSMHEDDEEEHAPVGFDLGACPQCRGCGHRKGVGFGV